ncbi:MAG: hypothetical protein ABL927_01980 [Bdellovibrionales bacterium]
MIRISQNILKLKINERIIAVLLFFMSAGLGQWAEARVFNFKTNGTSAYLKGTGAYSAIGDKAFADSSGSDTIFKDRVAYNFSGELGFSFLLKQGVNVRFGFEGLQTKSVDTTGKYRVNNTKYMDLNSKITVFNPNMALEADLKNFGTYRYFIFGGAGYANVKVINDYTVTAAGVTHYGSAAAYKETWAADVLSYQAGMGWEGFVFDNVTFGLDAGWRFLDISQFKYNADATIIRSLGSQAVAKGDVVVDDSAKNISLDMGGPFVGVTFKFYLPSFN